jgi:hypothetical protein
MVKQARSQSAGAPSATPVAATIAALESEYDAPAMEVDVMAEVRTFRGAQPMMVPPSEIGEQVAEDAGVAAWHNGKKVTATWCNSSVRNAYASVEGLGWKRLYGGNDSAFLALTMLAAHAEQTNSTSNIRIESDGQIHEIYVW